MWTVALALAGDVVEETLEEGARLAGVDPATLLDRAEWVRRFMGPPQPWELRWHAADGLHELPLDDDRARAIAVWACLGQATVSCDLRTLRGPEELAPELEGRVSTRAPWLDRELRWRDLAECCYAPDEGRIGPGGHPHLTVDGRTGRCQEWIPLAVDGHFVMGVELGPSRDPGFDPSWKPEVPNPSLRCGPPVRATSQADALAEVATYGFPGVVGPAASPEDAERRRQLATPLLGRAGVGLGGPIARHDELELDLSNPRHRAAVVIACLETGRRDCGLGAGPPAFDGGVAPQLVPYLDEQMRWVDLAACCDGIGGAPLPGERLVVEGDGRCHVAADVPREPFLRGEDASPPQTTWRCPSFHPRAHHAAVSDRDLPWIQGGGRAWFAELDLFPIPQVWVLGQPGAAGSFGGGVGLGPLLVASVEGSADGWFVGGGSLALLGTRRSEHRTTLYEDGTRLSIFPRTRRGEQLVRPGLLSGWLRRDQGDGLRIRPQLTAGKVLHLQVAVPVDLVAGEVSVGVQGGLALGL